MSFAPALSPAFYDPGIEAHIWRRYRPIAGHLRCGILLSAPGIEQWAAQALALLHGDPAILVHAIYYLEDTGRPAPSRPAALFERLQTWSNLASAPLARTGAIPAGISKALLRVESGALSAADAARLVEDRLDVLISLESRPLPADCSALARYGVWSVCCGDPDRPLSDPPYWQEVRGREPASTVTLQQHLSRGTRRLATCHAPTEPGVRFTANAAAPLSLAATALLRRALDLLENEQSLAPFPLRPAALETRHPPGNAAAALFLGRQALRSLSLRARARGRHPQWSVALRSGAGRFRSQTSRFSAQGFREVPAPAGHGYADPFVVEHRNRHWLFVEEMPGVPKGRLACMEIRGPGEFGEPIVILEKPYHLSYPQVIPYAGDFFLLPETADNGTVELYRATRFPYQWTLETVLCAGVAAVDTTVFHLDGIWYFFTTSARHGAETFLFWSDRLDGRWHYHPANPISSDVRRARGAGSLFYSGRDLIRPAQDCSVRYGYAIVLNRVKRLSPTAYEEEPLETILPDWRPGLLATHTLNSNSTYEALDAVRLVRD